MELIESIPFGRKNRIGRRLIVLIIAFSTLITLIVSVAQLVFEYHALRSDLDRQLDSVSIYVPNIASSLWDFDEQQLRLSLDALTQLPNIAQVSITAQANKTHWSAGKPLSHNTVNRSYLLRHVNRGKDLEIGRLDVVASLDAIDRQVINRAASIVISNGLKTFFVALFMAYLFRRLVTRRLGQLAGKVSALAEVKRSLSEPDGTQMPAVPEHLDELGAVEWSLDNTARRLDLAAGQMVRLNAELEQRVAEQDALLQNALVGIVMVRERKIVTCNRRFEEIFGYGNGELVGHPTSELYQDDSEYQRVGEESYVLLASGQNFNRTVQLRKRDLSQRISRGS